ncbi:MAG TPA: 30S ribosomal protein S3 [Candidatus Nanoarchaeia archaeon]|nr:30S ribosomal protein S3 [Candidatus Nanoarchaeia archaeon]
MIEREFVAQRTKEYQIKKFIEEKLQGVGISQIRLKKIPMGEKIILETSRPSLIVGKRGVNIREMTKTLKHKFRLENPQIEITEVKDIFLDPQIVADRIAGALERYGLSRFKGVGHKMMEQVMNSGAKGVEVVIAGKVPSARARSWRFYKGYLKKCGDIAIVGVRKAQATALLKTGIVGIKVAIMPPNLRLPDHIEVLQEATQVIEELAMEKEKKAAEEKAAAEKPKRKRPAKKRKKEEGKSEEHKEGTESAAEEVKQEVPAEETSAETVMREAAPEAPVAVEETPAAEVVEGEKENIETEEEK